MADGTSGTSHNGVGKATYTNSTDELTILKTGGNLRVFNLAGCAALIFNGDPVTVTNSAAVSPSQTITSP